MKKLFSLLIMGIALFMSGCGNYNLIDTTYEFHKVHIYETNKCYEIKSWTDYDGEQLQVDMKDYGVVLISSINCMLIADKCPICDAH